MKHRILIMILCVAITIGLFPISALATKNTEDIVILYENDVHCEVAGYSKLSAMKKELQEAYAHVGVVSSGDYIQGTSLGVISKGEYIVHLMNLVGYDALTLGNHEFDYRLERQTELVEMMNTKPVCCNFQQIDKGIPHYDPYAIVTYGDIDIAYIGVTTPATIGSSSPAQFKDENGNYIYSFCANDLYAVVQKYIDAAKAEGADYVIALTHLGDMEASHTVTELIANTEGFDVILDAHSHSVIEHRLVLDKSGNEVVLTSTGTKFEHIGKLTISNGEIQTELIKTADYTNTDPIVDDYLAKIDSEYSALGNRKIAVSEVELVSADADGNRLVRKSETNLGDFCADAVRYAVNADVAFINGGGVRSNIKVGDITFNDLLNIFPFNNQVVLAEVSGQMLKDMMEMAMELWPEENGSFPHMAGLTFSVNTSIPSSIVLDEHESFAGVSGPYRVYDIKVFNRESGKYEALDLTKKYTLAASNYVLLELGSGMQMLEDAKILQNSGMLDVEALEMYLTEELDGVIDERYATVTPNITFTEGEITTADENHGGAYIYFLIVVMAGAVLSVIIVYNVSNRKAKK